MNLVFDSSALIATFEGEEGDDFVQDILNDPEVTAIVHAVNLCEVYYIARRQYGEQLAQRTLADLQRLGVIVRSDMDDDFCIFAGRLKADFRRISLADCFCAALANRIGCEAVTANHEFEALAEAGACAVRFIR